MKQRRKLEVERLEDRQLLSDATMPPPLMPPPAPPPAVTPIDPTTAPSNPTTTSYQVQITALGPMVNGQLTSVTVQGLTPTGLTSPVPLSLQIGVATYTVDSVTILANGTCRLTVLGGINPNSIAVGGTARVYMGSGTYVPTYTTEPTAPPPIMPPPMTPPPTVPPIDPTMPYGT